MICTQKRTKKILLKTTVATIALLTSYSANAQVPVTDQAVTQNTANISSAVNNQVNLLRETKKIQENTFKSIGNFGALSPLSEETGWEDFKDGGKFGEAMREYSTNTCAIVVCKAEKGGEEADLTDLQTARSWIEKSFFPNDRTTTDQNNDLLAIRGKAAREASLSAYSLSLISRDSLAQVGDQSTKLESIVTSADSLREDMRANSAIAIAQYQQNAQMLALLTSLVENESVRILASSSISPMEGGSDPESIPNAYNEDDYDLYGNRVTITQTSEGESTGTTSNAEAVKQKSETIKQQNESKGNSGSTDTTGNDVEGLPWSETNPAMDSIKDQLPESVRDAEIAKAQNIMQQVGVISQIAQQALIASGRYEEASVLGNMSNAMQNAENDPWGVVWTGAKTIASQAGDPRLYQVVDMAQGAASSNDPASMDNLFNLAQNAAYMSGNTTAIEAIDQTRYLYQQGQISQQEAAMNAAYVTAQSSNDPIAQHVAQAMSYDASQMNQNQIYDMGMEFLNVYGQNTDNANVQQIINTAYMNKENIKQLTPNIPTQQQGQVEIEGTPWQNQ